MVAYIVYILLWISFHPTDPVQTCCILVEFIGSCVCSALPYFTYHEPNPQNMSVSLKTLLCSSFKICSCGLGMVVCVSTRCGCVAEAHPGLCFSRTSSPPIRCSANLLSCLIRRAAAARLFRREALSLFTECLNRCRNSSHSVTSLCCFTLEKPRMHWNGSC